MIKLWRISITIIFIFLAVLVFPVTSQTQVGNLFTFSRVGFTSNDYEFINVTGDASIDGGALQITPDSINIDFSLFNKSGRAMYKSPFKIWENSSTESKVISFNSTFLINVYPAPSRIPGSNSPGESIPGEGLAFVIAPSLETPPGSDGGFLGLTNRTMDNNPSNKFVAIELDTVKEDYDPNGNHMGLNINTVRSITTVDLTNHNISIAPAEGKNYTIWVQYNGTSKLLDVYMALQDRPRPENPLISETVDLMEYVDQESYFGFSASTGSTAQLNCILRWNLTVETFPKPKNRKWVTYLLAIGIPGVVLLVISLAGLGYYWYKLRVVDDPNLLGALKSLPGTPREFSYKDLKKATSNFDEKLKLGQGGFGVVYKGVLPNENTEVAVKKFSRESIKSKVDFLSELTIINRLRHKHLVRLIGWCHKNGMLLLVYEYMPNGSLDNHLFGEIENILSWNHRSKIIYGVVSGLQYLHNEYEQKVVHRDLKSNNIMLDLDYNARLGDFGLARAIDNERTSYAELEGIPGTLGYIAPECFHTGKATRESDVFGFGAVVLEVVCGERPWTKIEGFQCLVDWVWKLYREGRILEAVDQRLGNDYVVEEAEKLLLLGLACSHPIASERPKTHVIFQIISGSVPVPSIPPFKPSFVWPSMEPGNDESTMSNTNSQDETPVTSSYYGTSNSGWTPKSESRESYVRFKSDKNMSSVI